RAQALTLDTSLLRDLLGEADLRDLLDPRVVEEVEARVQRLDEPVPGAEATADVLREVGPLSAEEPVARGVDPAWLAGWSGAGRGGRGASRRDPGGVPGAGGRPARGSAVAVRAHARALHDG